MDNMLRYFIKRIVSIIPTIILVSIFVFLFVRLIPGDPARMLAGPDATIEDVQMAKEALGLDKPAVVQYFDYMRGLLKGDMGMSLKTRNPVSYEIGLRYWYTVRLTLVSILWSVIAGLAMGIISATNRGKWKDYAGMTLAVSGISVPAFWLGLMLIQFLPSNGGFFLQREATT